MRIHEVTLTVERVVETVAFYRDVLRLPVVTKEGSAEVTAGSSRLVLKTGAAFHGVHHLAFGIAPADFAPARRWLQARVDLVTAEGSVVIDGPEGWHSRSLYFLGPEGVLLELIARDADAAHAASSGPDPRLLGISEVGIGVPDVAAAVHTLTQDLGLPAFPPQETGFAPIGSHDGLLILVDQDRLWWPSLHQPAARGPLDVRLQAPSAQTLSLTPTTMITTS